MSKAFSPFRPALESLENRWCLHGGEFVAELEVPELAPSESHVSEPSATQEAHDDANTEHNIASQPTSTGESESSSTAGSSGKVLEAEGHDSSEDSPQSSESAREDVSSSKTVAVAKSSSSGREIGVDQSRENTVEESETHASNPSSPLQEEQTATAENEANTVSLSSANNIADKLPTAAKLSGPTKELQLSDSSRDGTVEQRKENPATSPNQVAGTALHANPAGAAAERNQVSTDGSDAAADPEVIRSLEPETVEPSIASTATLPDANQNQFAVDLSAMELGLRRFLDQMEAGVQDLVRSTSANPVATWAVGTSMGLGSAALAYYLYSHHVGSKNGAAHRNPQRPALRLKPLPV